MPHEEATISLPETIRYVEGANFPATKFELIEQARENHALDICLTFLDTLPDRTYGSIWDVKKMLGEQD